MSADSEMAQGWRQFKIARQATRSENRAQGAKFLRQRGVAFESKNGGAHLVVTCCPGRIVDFWPGTGLWMPRIAGMKARRRNGLESLLTYIEFTRKENK